MTSTLSNVIFPAFSAAYLALMVPFVAIPALILELVIFRAFNPSISFAKLLAIVLAANLVSWLAGTVLTGLMPSGLIP